MSLKEMPEEEFEGEWLKYQRERDRRESVRSAKTRIYDAYYEATRVAGMTKQEVLDFLKEQL